MEREDRGEFSLDYCDGGSLLSLLGVCLLWVFLDTNGLAFVQKETVKDPNLAWTKQQQSPFTLAGP